MRDYRSPWVTYGTFSAFHIFTNPERLPITRADIEACRYDYKLFKSAPKQLNHKLRMGMLVHGVEPGGPTSAVHTNDDLQHAVEAFRRTYAVLREERDVPETKRKSFPVCTDGALRRLATARIWN